MFDVHHDPPCAAGRHVCIHGEEFQLMEFLEHIREIANDFILDENWNKNADGIILVLCLQVFPGDPEVLFNVLEEERKNFWPTLTIQNEGEELCQRKQT
ncbi:MAG: hypothetical protein ACI92I_000202 [Acidimicrobiales bacterium]|jgi:hypothetical protein